MKRLIRTFIYILAVSAVSCTSRVGPLGSSRIAIFPNGKGYLEKQSFGYGECVDHYLISEVSNGVKTPIFRIELESCPLVRSLSFKFNIQNDTLLLLHSVEELSKEPSKIIKIGDSKFPIIIKYSYFEVAGIPEGDDILIYESKWDSVLSEARIRSKL